MVGKLPGTPKVPGSGRRRGSISKEDRRILTDKMAGDIMRVYTKLGGVAWLLQFAKDNPGEFIRQGLSRLFPAPIKEDPDVQINTQYNLSQDPTEVARRVAFALAAGLDAQDKPIVEHDDVPYSRLAAEDISPQEACHIGQPDPDREAWAQEVVMTPMERLDAESLDERCSRVATAPPRPEWMDAPRPGRPFVGVPRSKRDLF